MLFLSHFFYLKNEFFLAKISTIRNCIVTITIVSIFRLFQINKANVRFAIFSILSLPFTKYFTYQPKSCRLFCFMSGTEGEMSPRKAARSLQRHERKTTKRKDNGLTEREAENRCNARDAKMEPQFCFPLNLSISSVCQQI